VPQVRLEQNISGDIVQYKAQFLNALKLAALAIVPDADIDIKNQSTMQEIMKEVRRQFIIEKPLPEGLVEGYLQRLYKRNRAVYHRHWTLHGVESKPDDCSSAAWSQLVDYWQSMEGNKECERNKANASAKKCASVSYVHLDPCVCNSTMNSLYVGRKILHNVAKLYFLTVDLLHLSSPHAEKILTSWYMFGVYFSIQDKHKTITKDKRKQQLEAQMVGVEVRMNASKQ
jgi:hypothetical protein